MGGISAAQAAQKSWLQALALASGGRVFSTHGCDWAWLPTRRRLVLLFPEHVDIGGLRPALAEGARLGATRVDAWVNAATADAPLRDLGFRDGPPVLWHEGVLVRRRRGHGTAEGWPGRVRLSPEVPEASGRDRVELNVATHWRNSVGGRRHPSTQRRIEHAVAREDGLLRGRAFGQFTTDGAVSVHGLAVAAPARRRGVGRALLHGLVESLSRSNLHALETGLAAGPGGEAAACDDGAAARVMVAASPSSAGFFASNGLQLVGRGRLLRLD
ncbi:GNAT family N-acetyltransferase [Zhihengliuella sp.]|uniref:GNAT family N-acetyltransferase n=1 Tax=Zhihengliuella sp. TaxID=1954483 RepID=UPI002811056C|nr:GNAT family N-acetyltransferase [Zhihengliuella sp.]